MHFDNLVLIFLCGEWRPTLLWPNGWMDELTPLGTGVDIGAGHIVLDGFRALRERGTAPPPSFRPMSSISATAELLLIFYSWQNSLKEARAPEMYNSIPAQETAKHRAKLLTFVERRRCSNEAKTRNPLKLAGVPQTHQQISAVCGPKFTILSIIRTCRGGIAA